jgi:hydrogenase maturation protease
MGDEGVGVHFVNRLIRSSDHLRWFNDYNVNILDGGTAGFQLIEYLEHHSTVIIVDAILDKNPPGTIRLIEPRFSKDFPKAMSTHEIGLKDLVEALSLMERLPKIYLYVVSVADISNLHVGLSDDVAKSLSKLETMVREKISLLSKAQLV